MDGRSNAVNTGHNTEVADFGIAGAVSVGDNTTYQSSVRETRTVACISSTILNQDLNTIEENTYETSNIRYRFQSSYQRVGIYYSTHLEYQGVWASWVTSKFSTSQMNSVIYKLIGLDDVNKGYVPGGSGQYKISLFIVTTVPNTGYMPVSTLDILFTYKTQFTKSNGISPVISSIDSSDCTITYPNGAYFILKDLVKIS